MAYRYDLRIDQGATFALDIECDIPLTGYTAAAQIRQSYSSASTLAVFSAIVNESAQTVELSLSAAGTAAIPAGINAGVWDCEITAPGGTVQRIVEGKVHVTPEVTR